jgi:hypothetical protein
VREVREGGRKRERGVRDDIKGARKGTVKGGARDNMNDFRRQKTSAV